jgi:hypothetical protein
MRRDWRAGGELRHFKALGLHGLPYSAVLHWSTDAAAQGADAGGVWELALHPALKVENLLPCRMSLRLITSQQSDPPSPRGPAGALWSIDLASGAGQAILDRDFTPGSYVWLSVKLPDWSWSSPVLLRDGRLSREASSGSPPLCPSVPLPLSLPPRPLAYDMAF